VLLAQTFDPYGNLYASAGAGRSRFGYTGEYQDASGLLYLRARYYDPAQGRFFQPDAWRGNAYQPQTLNTYMYVMGSPVTLTDQSGYCYDVRGLRTPLGPLTALGPLTSFLVWDECRENISRFAETLNPDTPFIYQLQSFYFNVTPSGVTQREQMIDTAEDLEAVNRWFHDHEYYDCNPSGYIADFITTFGVTMKIHAVVSMVVMPVYVRVRTPVIRAVGGNPQGILGSNVPDIRTVQAWTGKPGTGFRLGEPLNINVELTTGRLVPLVRGGEIRIGSTARIAPLGNQSSVWYEGLTHYHLRGPIDPVTGQPRAGQGIGRHRPWQSSADDIYVTDMFFNIKPIIDFFRGLFGP
jgi:RHS repeat-associated protein